MFDSYITFHARARPSALAIVTTNGRVNFEKFDKDINRAVAELNDLRVAVDESVSVAVANPYLEWVLVLALSRRGIATAPSTDIASQQRISDGSDTSCLATFMLAPEAINRIFHGPVRPTAPRRPEESALARILVSSGTTGEQKRLGMSWKVIDAAIRNALVAYGAPDGPWLASTGIGTILGLVVTLACWASGNAAVLGMGGTLLPHDLAIVRPRLIALVPDQLQRLLDKLPEHHEKWPLRIITGGGPVPPALAQRTRFRLTDDLRSVYGASETGAVAIAGLSLLEDVVGAAGYVLPMVDVEIIDELGRPQPAGTLGRVRIRSNRVADHWLDGMPQSASTSDEGWFQSADLGRLSEDGLLLIEGRVDDVMNLGGHKVLPAWIEKAALTCPGVKDVAAFSVSDDNGLEQCWLALVITPGVTLAQIEAVLKHQLIWLKRIKLLPLEILPRNEMGKVQRDQLRNLALKI